MRLRWTDSALHDFTNICDYIEKHSGSTIARRVALSIYRQIDLLQQFPESGRTGRKSDTRELVLTSLPYILIYRIQQDAVELLRILHAAQHWPE
jgi:toxin ParE1/3/4